MATVILRYTGQAESMASELEQLRYQLPDVVLTRKTDTLVEAQLDESRLPTLLMLNGWEATAPTFAEIKAPPLDWSHIRNALGD